MKPSKKSPKMEKFLDEVTGVCTWCRGDASEFRDALSRKEYTISGFCQKSQDATFGGGGDYG